MSKSNIAIQSNIWESNSILKEKRQSSNKQSYMPFLFRSKRQFINMKQQSPPVGAYQIPSAFESIKSESQPNILKEQLQRKNQMGIFKSSQQRFIANKNIIPGPASYDYIKNASQTKLFNQKQTSIKQKQKFSLIKRSPSCPAIPDSKVRYGYAKDDQGNYKLIQKSEIQVQREKLKLKEYCSTLVGENQFMKRLKSKQELEIIKPFKQQQQIFNNLEKFVDRKPSSGNSSEVCQIQKTIKMNKPKIKLSHGANVIEHNENHLGPGCYNVSLDTLKKNKKVQNFQFFSSSQIRFSSLIKDSNINPYDHLFREKKNMKLNSNIQGKVYKKSFPIGPIDPYFIEKLELPGPGYYEPEVDKIKKSQGKVIFGYESRFKQNSLQLNECDEQETQKEIGVNENNIRWGNLRKDKIKSPHKQFEPVNQSQIYGIMNQQPSELNFNAKKTKLNTNNNKQSAVFKDKSSRLNLSNKIYYQSETQDQVMENKDKIWTTKGSFMSKLSKKCLQVKENTPGPGTYNKQGMGKKSFNIKNL